MRLATPSADYDYLGRRRAWSTPFSVRSRRRNTSVPTCAGCCTAASCTRPSERGEGYIAYKRPKEKLGFKTLWPIATGMLHNSSMKRLMRFAMAIKKGGKSLQERMDKEKKPYIFVGMVCVCEKFQGQGYMRKVMDIAFAEGDRLRVPVILETDARSKCDKYVHLGMELAGTRDLGEFRKNVRSHQISRCRSGRSEELKLRAGRACPPLKKQDEPAAPPFS